MMVETVKEGSYPPCQLCKFLFVSPSALAVTILSLCTHCSFLRSVDSWVSRNRCTNLTTNDFDNGTVHFSSWTCGGVNGALEHYREDDMGHVWASQTQTFSQAIIGEGPTKLEANDIIMKFFDRFALDKENNGTAPSTFTAASSDLLPVAQATGTGSLTIETASTTSSATPTKSTIGTGTASPTTSGSSDVGGIFGVGLLALLSSVGTIGLALL